MAKINQKYNAKILTGIRASNYKNIYSKTECNCLETVYKKYSDNKCRAYSRCYIELMRDNGKLAKIISTNTCYFVYAYKVKDGLIVLTYANKYFIEGDL